MEIPYNWGPDDGGARAQCAGPAWPAEAGRLIIIISVRIIIIIMTTIITIIVIIIIIIGWLSDGV